MKVLVADTCGLCYGSKKAFDTVNDSFSKNKKVVLYKELLHNKNVIKSFNDKGIIVKEDLKAVENDDFLIIRAHGEPLSTFNYLDKKGIKYADCTCPNVKAIDVIVNKKYNEGYSIIIIGKKKHDEVIATDGWCNNEATIIENEDDINNCLFDKDKYFLVIQTTFSIIKANCLLELIKEKMVNKTFDYRITICNAQKLINESAFKLAKKVDIIIVVGGKHSSNCLELFNNIKEIKEAYFIEDLNELKLLLNDIYVDKDKTIGLTGGASTLYEDILTIKNFLENL